MAATYEALKDAIRETDCSSGITQETAYLMKKLRLPSHFQMQIKKLLAAGNPERALKLVSAYEDHESWWSKLMRKVF